MSRSFVPRRTPLPAKGYVSALVAFVGRRVLPFFPLLPWQAEEPGSAWREAGAAAGTRPRPPTSCGNCCAAGRRAAQSPGPSRCAGAAGAWPGGGRRGAAGGGSRPGGAVLRPARPSRREGPQPLQPALSALPGRVDAGSSPTLD